MSPITFNGEAAWFRGLKGRDIPAQGNALGTGCKDCLALQGRDNIQISDSLVHLCNALSGLILLLNLHPGRCPGLICNALSGLDQKGINSVSKQIVGEVRTNTRE